MSILVPETSNNGKSTVKFVHFVWQDIHSCSNYYKKFSFCLYSEVFLYFEEKVFYFNCNFFIPILTKDDCLGNKKIFTQAIKDFKAKAIPV